MRALMMIFICLLSLVVNSQSIIDQIKDEIEKRDTVVVTKRFIISQPTENGLLTNPDFLKRDVPLQIEKVKETDGYIEIVECITTGEKIETIYGVPVYVFLKYRTANKVDIWFTYCVKKIE